MIVKNHGVTEDQKKRLFETSKMIFGQASDVKQKYEDINNGGSEDIFLRVEKQPRVKKYLI